MQVKSIAECSLGLQYVRPALSYHLSLNLRYLYIWVAAHDRFYCKLIKNGYLRNCSIHNLASIKFYLWMNE